MYLLGSRGERHGVRAGQGEWCRAVGSTHSPDEGFLWCVVTWLRPRPAGSPQLPGLFLPGTDYPGWGLALCSSQDDPRLAQKMWAWGAEDPSLRAEQETSEHSSPRSLQCRLG